MSATDVKKEKRKYMTVDGGGGKENIGKEQEAGTKPASRTKDETPEKKRREEELSKDKTTVRMFNLNT